jgi:hypothetical protein
MLQRPKLGGKIMKKPLEKKKIRSARYRVKVLFDPSAQYSTTSPEDKQTDPSEIGIDHLTAYIDRIAQAHTDGYWSVLREL